MARITIAERVRPLLHLSDTSIAGLLGIRLKAAQIARRRLTGQGTTGWTAEAKTWAVAQGRNGVAAATIANNLRAKFGIKKTPNAIIGMLARAGVSVRQARAKAAPPAARSAFAILRSFDALEGSACRWPFDDPSSPNFHFCGRPQQTGKPYCPEHCRVAYQAPPAPRGTQQREAA